MIPIIYKKYQIFCNKYEKIIKKIELKNKRKQKMSALASSECEKNFPTAACPFCDNELREIYN